MGVLACKALEDPQKFAGLSTRFPKPISLLLGQYRCWIAENIIATVTDSSQMKKNNELMKYVKNSDCNTARAIFGPPIIDCAAEGGALQHLPGHDRHT